MNPSVVLLCLALAFMISEASPVRGGWASGADRDRDPTNPNLPKANAPANSKSPQHSANAVAVGNNANAFTLIEKKGNSRFAFSKASSSGNGPKEVFSSASA